MKKLFLSMFLGMVVPIIAHAQTPDADSNRFFHDPEIERCALPLTHQEVLQTSDNVAIRSSLSTLARQIKSGDQSLFTSGALEAVYKAVPFKATGNLNVQQKKLEEATRFLQSEFSFARDYRYFLKRYSPEQLDVWLKCTTLGKQRYAITVSFADADTIKLSVLWNPLARVAMAPDAVYLDPTKWIVSGIEDGEVERKIGNQIAPSGRWQQFDLKRAPDKPFSLSAPVIGDDAIPALSIAKTPRVPNLPCTRLDSLNRCERFVVPINVQFKAGIDAATNILNVRLPENSKFSVNFMVRVSAEVDVEPDVDGHASFRYIITNIKTPIDAATNSVSVQSVFFGKQSGNPPGERRWADIEFAFQDDKNKNVAWMAPDATGVPSLRLYQTACTYHQQAPFCRLFGFVGVDVRYD